MYKPAVARPALLLCAWLTIGCTGKLGDDRSGPAPAPGKDGRLFTTLPSSYTGVRFANRLNETPERNVFSYRNYYNGGGVAIGDLNGDGLPEIVLTGNETGPTLYLNGGAFRFRDVTEESGLVTKKNSWTTGVTLADVNGDGKLDIYICKAGPLPPAERGNELWINQGLDAKGVPTFKEMAAQYGVADQGYSIQAVFLDYDRDGDLDLFVINNSPRPVSSFGMRNTRDVRDPWGGERLYRNDGGHFVDVSAAAGIHSPEVAFGLGVAVADVNNDGWPDIYVSNDFFERDYLYINKGDGTFSEKLDEQMPVTSYFSMGLDVADVDNDGWPDVYTTDMLPADELRLKTTTSFEGWDVYTAKLRNGYHHQLMRNMLQRNNRDGTFSDIGEIAGVSRTDWSWSALIADLDLDGRKDIVVTNGLAKDITSQDYVAFLANEQTMRAVTSEGRGKVDFMRLTKAMSSTPLPNYVFHNEGPMRFTSVAAQWGLATPSFSSGAAYGDLDGDGALDLVVNNVNQEAFVYRNDVRTVEPKNRFLRVRLDGEGTNRFGIDARVALYAGADRLVQEQAPSRGFESSVDYVLVFGLGARDTVDSMRVSWPDGRENVLRRVAANQTVTVHQATAVRAAPVVPPRIVPRVADVTDAVALPYVHRENDFVDFDQQRLIPKMLSTEGPFIAVGDVNRDGLDDFFIGGARGQPGALLVQRPDGRFARTNEALFLADSVSEDLGAVFFDANGDGAPDLYVVSGGNEFSPGAPALEDRLYLNDGRGNFRKAVDALPPLRFSGSRVVAADFDGDGDIDLFVGGRVVPGSYGMDPPSVILANDGHGKFTDVTAKVAPALASIGMVTDAAWRDVDGDGRPDLIVVGEWMPITIFHNAGGRLEPMKVPGLEKSNGWWNRILVGDFTGDGKVDFIVGNLGLNGELRAAPDAPTRMYVKDFDGNDFVEQIVTQFHGGKEYPLWLRDDLVKSLPYLKPRYTSYKDYALQTVTDVFPPDKMQGAVVKTAYTFATTLVRNDGNGSFTMVPLPDEAQLAPVYGLYAADLDRDGHLDLMLAGNFDGFKPQIGMMAASRGLVLRGDGKGGWVPMSSQESGFVVPGQARDIARLRTRQGDLYVVARNNDRPLLFRPTRQGGGTIALRANRGGETGR